VRRDGVSTSDESRSDLRLAKAKVAGSNPVFRSIQDPDAAWFFPPLGVAGFERFERVSPSSVRHSLMGERWAARGTGRDAPAPPVRP